MDQPFWASLKGASLMDTLNDALEGAVTDEAVSGEPAAEESSAEEKPPEAKPTEEESSEDSQTKDESADESKKTEEKEESESKDEDETKESEKSEETKDEEAKEDEESFTKLDPNDLPDEVKPVYKSLLGDYTRKRQQEAKTVKDLQDRNAILEEQVKNGGQNPPVEIDLTPEQMKEMSVQQYTDYVIQKTQESSKVTQESKDEAQFEQDAVTGFLSLDARLNPELKSSFDSRFAKNVGVKVDEDHTAHIKATGSSLGFDYKASAEQHIKDWDDWVANIKKESVKKTTEVSKKKANKLKKSAPPTKTGDSKSSKNMDLDGSVGAAFADSTE